ncbi:MAG: hypothetical protein IJK18_07235 [Clostridia bacterium]|nr:hypothetical protein [Clostridia bacterium]
MYGQKRIDIISTMTKKGMCLQMKWKKIIIGALILVALAIFSIFFYFYKSKNYNKSNINEINIFYYDNNPLAGISIYGDMSVKVNILSNNAILKYYNNINEKEYHKNKNISSEQIIKILNLAKNGRENLDKDSSETYVVYCIEYGNINKYIDSEDDIEGIISNLFKIDE